MTFHFLNSYAQFLPRAFDEANFNFFSRTLRGVTAAARPLEARPRRARRHARRGGRRDLRPPPLPGREPAADGRADRQPARRLRRAAAQPVVDGRARPGPRRSPSSTRSIRASATRSRFIDYSPIRVDRDDLLGNAIRAGEFDWNLQLSRLPSPVDRSLWAMTPQTINAYYSPLTNQITFPAAILQPPLFQPVGRSGGQLRRDRRDHRPRDRPRLRRPGPPLRRARAGSATGGRRNRPRASPSRPARLGAQYNGYAAIPGLNVNGAAHHGREYRRSRRARNGLCRLSPPRRPAWRAAGDRRPDRRPALLPRLRPGLAQPDPRGRAQRARADRSAQPARMAGQRRRPQRRRLVRAPSTSSPATGSICRPSNGCTSGKAARPTSRERGRATGPFLLSGPLAEQRRQRPAAGARHLVEIPAAPLAHEAEAEPHRPCEVAEARDDGPAGGIAAALEAE